MNTRETAEGIGGSSGGTKANTGQSERETPPLLSMPISKDYDREWPTNSASMEDWMQGWTIKEILERRKDALEALADLTDGLATKARYERKGIEGLTPYTDLRETLYPMRPEIEEGR